MAKLIVWNLISLDGYFEGRDKWDLGFHQSVWGPELEQISNDFGRRAAMLVFGRVTYEGMKAYWTTADDDPAVASYMNALPKLVASRTLTASDWTNTRVTADPVGELTRLKAAEAKDIFVFGSAQLTDALLDAGLVDELMLCLAPMVLGGGVPFFKPREAALNLSLLESRALSTGGVILRYAPA